MKKIFLGTVLLVCIGLAGAFAASKVDLVQYKNFDAAYAGIDKQAKAGWLPVGIDAFDEGKYAGIWILYVDNFPLAKKGSSWDLLKYPDSDKLEADLTFAVKKGWTPIDFAEDSDNTYVIYLKTSYALKDWDLKAVGDAEKEINANAADELADGWVPLGLHQDADGKESLLYAQFKGTNPVSSVDIVRYEDYDQLRKDVQANAAKGWTPVGFTADDTGGIITVIFIK